MGPAAKRGPAGRADITNESNPRPTIFHACPEERNPFIEGRGRLIFDDDIVRELVVVHRDLSDKFREVSEMHGGMSDKLSTVLKTRL